MNTEKKISGEGVKIKRMRMWKPVAHLPWKAVKKGTADYIWYDIIDCDGWDVCTFGAVRPGTEEAEDQFRQMCMILLRVNDTGEDIIQVDKKDIEIEWMGGDDDPTPYCSWCYSMTKAKCKCGPRADND